MADQNSLFTIEERFASELRDALRKRYGSIPSAAFVTIQFNRRLASKNGVSQECVRRWLRGLSMPSYLHLQILALWLGLRLASLLGVEDEKEFEIHSETIQRLAEIVSQMPVEAQAPLLNLVLALTPLSSGYRTGFVDRKL